jgi:hypothetical protein
MQALGTIPIIANRPSWNSSGIFVKLLSINSFAKFWINAKVIYGNLIKNYSKVFKIMLYKVLSLSLIAKSLIYSSSKYKNLNLFKKINSSILYF